MFGFISIFIDINECIVKFRKIYLGVRILFELVLR